MKFATVHGAPLVSTVFITVSPGSYPDLLQFVLTLLMYFIIPLFCSLTVRPDILRAFPFLCLFPINFYIRFSPLRYLLHVSQLSSPLFDKADFI
jgi:hypothetical protein